MCCQIEETFQPETQYTIMHHSNMRATGDHSSLEPSDFATANSDCLYVEVYKFIFPCTYLFLIYLSLLKNHLYEIAFIVCFF